MNNKEGPNKCRINSNGEFSNMVCGIRVAFMQGKNLSPEASISERYSERQMLQHSWPPITTITGTSKSLK